MRERSDVHDFLERSGIPVFLVVCIPLLLILFANWNTIFPSAASAQPQQEEQPTQSTPAAATLTLNSSSTIPASVSAGQLVPFSFTIGNPGTVNAQYQYKVYVKWSTGEEDVIDENILPLAGGASKMISENLKFELSNESAQVYIEIPSTGQTIQFSIPK